MRNRDRTKDLGKERHDESDAEEIHCQCWMDGWSEYISAEKRGGLGPATVMSIGMCHGLSSTLDRKLHAVFLSSTTRSLNTPGDAACFCCRRALRRAMDMPAPRVGTARAAMGRRQPFFSGPVKRKERQITPNTGRHQRPSTALLIPRAPQPACAPQPSRRISLQLQRAHLPRNTALSRNGRVRPTLLIWRYFWGVFFGRCLFGRTTILTVRNSGRWQPKKTMCSEPHREAWSLRLRQRG